MRIETFSKLIVNSFTDKNSITMFVRENYPEMDEKQQISKIRNIRRYVESSVVPPYQVAKELLEKLEIDVSEDDLINILNYSKEERDADLRYKQTLFIENMNIKYDEIFVDMNLSLVDKERIIRDRINMIDVNDSIKKYVIKLIEKDVENGIL